MKIKGLPQVAVPGLYDEEAASALSELLGFRITEAVMGRESTDKLEEECQLLCQRTLKEILAKFPKCQARYFKANVAFRQGPKGLTASISFSEFVQRALYSAIKRTQKRLDAQKGLK